MPLGRSTGIALAAVFASPCLGAPAIHSAGNAFSDNPFIAIGVNPATHVVTGYVAALLTAPGRTNACKFVFRGPVMPDGQARLSIRDAVPGSAADRARPGAGSTVLTATGATIRLDLPKPLAPGDCEWVLDSVGVPHIATTATGWRLTVDGTANADWTGVVAIRSRRAFFHDGPDAATVRKAFLVAGDVAYVMEEKGSWYRVRFTHAARETAGWIKASDTVQF